MMRSLFAGVSGLRNHQTRMDVIGNNIANVNTTSFKSSRVTFAESFNQVVQGARRPPDDAGGQNPVQIGSGMQVASIDQKFTQGTIESTGVTTDVAIQGDGFFVVRGNGRTQYTRAGNFQFDAQSRLVSPANGYIVQGINADTQGNFSAASQITDIDLSQNLKSPARATQRVSIVGNLNRNQPELNPMPGAPAGPAFSRTQSHQMGITVYDSLGQAHNLQMTIQQQWTTGSPPVPDNNQWRWSLSSPTATVSAIDQTASGGAPQPINAQQGVLRFNNSGQLVEFTNGVSSITTGDVRIRLVPNGGGQAVDIALNPGSVNDINGFSQFANPSNAVFANQDGFTAGDLTSISIDSTGTITGFYTNGVSRPVAQIALARFNNPSGLLRRGGNMYEPSANSGLGILGFAGTSNTSSITASALEGSNVDVSEEFTNMIVTQRGFQANARVITTSDEMLTELVNLRR